jgi:2,5-diamino-6-(ribosylamino)-4(3H)-pyrimidinone 5'-phosphate reductase
MAFESDEVRRLRHEIRAKSDAIMVGSNTIRIDNPLLTVRHVEGPNPLRVIPASMADIPYTAHVINDGGPTLIAVGAQAPEKRVRRLLDANVAVFRTSTNVVDLSELLEHLYSQDVRSLMVEGGTTLLSALFRSRLVDRLIVQHLPIIFGGDSTPCMIGGPSIDRIDDAIKIQLLDVYGVGGHAIIEYDCRLD